MSSFLENFIKPSYPQSEERERGIGYRRWWYAFMDDFADVLCGLRHQGVTPRLSEGLKVERWRRLVAC